jgi:hypothetical protein
MFDDGRERSVESIDLPTLDLAEWPLHRFVAEMRKP